MLTERLRIIAGPNGSGKTTLYFFLKENIPTAIWLNADVILEQFNKKGFIEYAVLGFVPTYLDFKMFCKKKSSKNFIKEYKLARDLDKISFGKFSVAYISTDVSNQLAAFLVDFFRELLLLNGVSFTTETVLSHPSKLNLVKLGKDKGYRTYLYFIGTNSPLINIGRIKSRVFKGGHDVPEEKINSRYTKSIALLTSSIALFDRVYLFDNSSKVIQLIASYENSKLEKIYQDNLPKWVDFLFKNN